MWGVDDSKFMRKHVPKYCWALGYRVLIACNGKTGLFAAESCSPSLILLDMLMPDMDRLEVLQTLKRRSIRRSRPGID
jgi:CheY-like chemotaxis protein